MHVVTWDTSLGTFNDAKVLPDGIAVLGFLFQVGDGNFGIYIIIYA